jgi:hypothetical protein
MNRIQSLCVIFVALLGITACESMIEGPEDEVSPDPPANGTMISFSTIQTQVFSTSCALSGCHSGLVSPDLRAGNSYAQLVDVLSSARPDLMRVKPGDSQNSYLIKKLTGDGTSRMPPPPRPAIDAAIIDSVKIWIDRGAKND